MAVIAPATNVRWNIALTYGDFLLGLPRRLGANQALDAAVRSLLSAHTDVCIDRTRVSSTTLALYGNAVSSLRSCLDDPSTASATETLCAVYIIIIQQVSQFFKQPCGRRLRIYTYRPLPGSATCTDMSRHLLGRARSLFR